MRNLGVRWSRGRKAAALLLLALALAAEPTLAQDVAPPPRTPRPPAGSRVSPILTLLPAIGAAAVAAAAASAQPPPAAAAATPPRPRRTPASPPPRPAPRFVVRAFPPPPGETRFRRGEILVETAPGASPASVAQVARRHRLIEAEAVDIALLRVSIRLWRIPDSRDVGAVVRELAGEPALAGIQPNYLYTAQQDAAAAPPPPPPQYALAKLHVDATMSAPPHEAVRVALIDTAVDETHPDLAGAVEARFDAIGGAPARALDHGTSIAGAIAARGRLKGVDPNVRLLCVRAFDVEGAGMQGATLAILKGIDWAAREHARVVNMSFAGPPDPALHAILAAAFAQGMTLVAAAGNAGPKSPPLYPGADETVLAVTATDADDRLYEKANVGRYVAVAAPGVDVLLPAPQGGYAMETGTSVSAALVSGVAALLLERRPAAPPSDIRKLIVTTAAPLGGAGRSDEFGAGLVDAHRAVSAAR